MNEKNANTKKTPFFSVKTRQTGKDVHILQCNNMSVTLKLIDLKLQIIKGVGCFFP